MDEQLIGFAATGAIAGCAGALINALITQQMLRSKNITSSDNNSAIKNYLTELSGAPEAHHFEKVKLDILTIFDNFMSNKLTEKMPVLKMFIDEQLIKEIREVFHQEMEANLPQLFKENFSPEKNAGLISSFIGHAIKETLKTYRRKVIQSAVVAAVAGAVIGMGLSVLYK